LYLYVPGSNTLAYFTRSSVAKDIF
jgi:hypothetical protein